MLEIKHYQSIAEDYPPCDELAWESSLAVGYPLYDLLEIVLERGLSLDSEVYIGAA